MADQTFVNRVEAVFSTLDSSANAGWSLSQHQVYRAGKQDEYSSEEEEEAQGRGREELFTGSLVDFEGPGDEGEAGLRELPTVAFCNALDREDNFDIYDAVASGADAGVARELRPLPTTEVLPDNAYERRSASAEASQVELRKQGPPPWVPPHKRDSEQGRVLRDEGPTCARLRTGDTNGSVSRPPLPPRRSRVPDHVRNPGRYTVYTLDSPIEVGSGVDGGSELADMERAARAASSAAQSLQMRDGPQEGEQPDADLPAFGSGIEFVPRHKADAGDRATGPKQASIQEGPTSIAAAAADEEQEAAEAATDIGQAMEEDSGFRSRPSRTRNLRKAQS